MDGHLGHRSWRRSCHPCVELLVAASKSQGRQTGQMLRRHQGRSHDEAFLVDKAIDVLETRRRLLLPPPRHHGRPGGWRAREEVEEASSRAGGGGSSPPPLEPSPSPSPCFHGRTEWNESTGRGRQATAQRRADAPGQQLPRHLLHLATPSSSSPRHHGRGRIRAEHREGGRQQPLLYLTMRQSSPPSSARTTGAGRW